MPNTRRARPEVSTTAPVRPKGRQAEAAVNDGRVLEAAREVFATAGWGAPVSLVAQRAGVGMGSLYRRYGSKQDLLQYLCLLSLEQLTQHAEFALEQSMAEPWDAFETFVHRCVLNRVGAFGSIAGRLPASPAMSKAAELAHQRVTQLVSALQNSAVLRRDVTAVDVHELLELFSRRDFLRERLSASHTNRHEEEPPDDRLLAIILSGMRAHADLTSLPAAASWAQYRARWDTQPQP